MTSLKKQQNNWSQSRTQIFIQLGTSKNSYSLKSDIQNRFSVRNNLLLVV